LAEFWELLSIDDNILGRAKRANLKRAWRFVTRTNEFCSVQGYPSQI